MLSPTTHFGVFMSIHEFVGVHKFEAQVIKPVDILPYICYSKVV